jgi:hypothetical protein
MAARMDAARYGRIWELSIRGAIARDVVGLVPVEEHPGAVEVRRYERAPAVVVADITVARSEGGGARVELAEVAFEPHRCVLVSAPAGRPVRVRFPGLALGTELVGYVGIADVFTRRSSREPATLEVEIAGAKLASATAPIDSWVPFRAVTVPGIADVAFILRWTPAPRTARNRHPRRNRSASPRRRAGDPASRGRLDPRRDHGRDRVANRRRSDSRATRPSTSVTAPATRISGRVSRCAYGGSIASRTSTGRSRRPASRARSAAPTRPTGTASTRR